MKNLNSKILLAGALLSSGQALAAEPMPKLCNSAINYAVQTLDLGLSDGTFADAYDPASVTIKKNTKTYPVTQVKYLGSCDDDQLHLPPAWCQVAGGSPDVWQAEVSRVDGNYSTPAATVVVTYNRGGCRVDKIEKAEAK